MARGIYGAEVCQICGSIDTFSGWAAAMGSHFPMNCRPSDFVCRHCRSRLGSDRARVSQRVSEILRDRDYRFCTVCTGRLAAEERNRAGRFWICPSCREKRPFDTAALGEHLEGFVRKRSPRSRGSQVK